MIGYTEALMIKEKPRYNLKLQLSDITEADLHKIKPAQHII